MEVTNGFIVGVFNYCDRWCETCRLTSWCRLFADDAEAQAANDPHLKAVADAPPLRHEIREIPPEFQKLLEEVEENLEKMTDEEMDELCQTPNDKDPLLERATAYAVMVHEWLGVSRGGRRDPGDPRSTIAWFSTMIPAKIARALHGMGMPYLDPDEPTDHDGSAKVALLGLERSRAAWEQLAATENAAGPAIAELAWLEREVERMFPRARRFVRPAFDEPEDVARLLAQEDAAR